MAFGAWLVRRWQSWRGPGKSEPLGRVGEKKAVRFLRARGHKVLAVNYQCPCGEIDIITRDGPEIVFVEVKTRRTGADCGPEDAVHCRKRKQIVSAAKFFLGARNAESYPCRFDVVWIVWSGERHPEIQHLQDAFEPVT